MRKFDRMGSGLAAVALVALVALVAGCGSSGGSSASSSSSTKKPPVIAITAAGGDGSWQFKLPAAGVHGGVVTLRLTNTSAKDTHDFQLASVDSGHTAAEVQKIIASEEDVSPTWLHGLGGVPTVAPGRTGEVTMDLAPGHYFFFCNDDTEGKKHAANGMFGEFDVTGRSGAALPKPTAHVDASEYKFATSGLKAGKNLVEFRNIGKEIHMVLAAPIAAGKTIEDVKTAFASQDHSQGPPPIEFEKAVGAEVLDPNHSVFSTWTLAPGKYAFVCFMTDHAGGPPHFVKGMLQEVNIS